MIGFAKRIGLFYKKGNVESFEKVSKYFSTVLCPIHQKKITNIRKGMFVLKNGDILEIVGISADYDVRGKRYDGVIVDRQHISLQEYETIIKPLIKPNKLYI